MSITPTIGRKVWFHPSAAQRSYMRQYDHTLPVQPLDATICYVSGENQVTVRVHDHNGIPHIVTKVQLHDGAPRGDGDATWMPYQIGQAKATNPLVMHQSNSLFPADLDKMIANSRPGQVISMDPAVVDKTAQKLTTGVLRHEVEHFDREPAPARERA